MTQPGPSPEKIQRAIQQQAGKLLSQVAGYVGVRTIDIGLRFGLLEELAKHPQGITAEALARQKGLDPFYVQVRCPEGSFSANWSNISGCIMTLGMPPMYPGKSWSRSSLSI